MVPPTVTYILIHVTEMYPDMELKKTEESVPAGVAMMPKLVLKSAGPAEDDPLLYD